MLKVLVVDDDPTIIKLTTDFFNLEEWSVESAPNGKVALDILDSSFNAVILDLSMPIMNGETTLIEIRKRYDLNEVCVIILTGFGEISSATRSVRHGAYQYLEKPFDLAELKRMLISGIAQQKAHALRREILTIFDIDIILDRICSIIVSTINPEGLHIIFLDPDGNVRKIRNVGKQYNDGDYNQLKTRRHFVQHIIDSKQPVFESDLKKIDQWEPIIENAKSILAAPIPGHKGEVVGIIDIESLSESAFDHDWVEVIDFLSDMLGISIEIIEKATLLSKLLIEKEQWRKMILLSKELGHQILTPTHVISMQIQTLKTKELQSESFSQLPQHIIHNIFRRVNVVDKNANTISHVCKYLRDISNEITLRKENCNFIEILYSCIEEYQSDFDDNQIQVNFSAARTDNLIFEGDEGLIKYVIQCILSNAIESIQRRRALTVEKNVIGEIDITLELDEGNEQIALAIQDTGTGIAEEHLNQTFEPLFTTKAGSDTLNGLGLFSARRIINLHEGSINAENNPSGPGAIFEIHLPIRQEFKSEYLQRGY